MVCLTHVLALHFIRAGVHHAAFLFSYKGGQRTHGGSASRESTAVTFPM